jgi:hypothetical protein
MVMKWERGDLMLHIIFVDDFASTQTSKKLSEQFPRLNVPGGDQLAPGYAYPRTNQEVSAAPQEGYQTKKGPHVAGLVLEKEDCPAMQDPSKQKRI